MYRTFALAVEAMGPDHELFRRGLDHDVSGSLRRALTEMLSDEIRELYGQWQRQGRIGDLDLEVVVAYNANGLVGVLEAWCRAPVAEADPARWLTALETLQPAWWPQRGTS